MTAGSILYIWTVRRGDREGDRPTAAHWRSAFIIGGLLLFVETGAVAWAVHRQLDTGVIALLCATVPLWLVGLDGIVSGRRLGSGTVAGMCLGLIGVAVLVGPSASKLDLPAVLAVLAGTVAWACGSLYARRAPRPRRRNVGAGMEMIAAGSLLAIGGAVTGELGQVHPGAISAAGIGAMAYLILFGSLVAYTAYGWLLQNVSTAVASTYGYVNPVIAVVLGWFVLGEPLTGSTVFAGLLVVLSVVMIMGFPKRKQRPRIPRGAGLPTPALADFSRLAA
ncbi:MAG: EamA family transporter [Gaiellaceae bacterium]